MNIVYSSYTEIHDIVKDTSYRISLPLLYMENYLINKNSAVMIFCKAAHPYCKYHAAYLSAQIGFFSSYTHKVKRTDDVSDVELLSGMDLP